MSDLVKRLLDALEERVWVFDDNGAIERNTCSGCGASHSISQPHVHLPGCPIERLLKEAASQTIDWRDLGTSYPAEGEYRVTKAVFDVLAPIKTIGKVSQRLPIFEWGHETTPTPQQVWKLSDEIVTSVIRSFLPK
jgi:hypothetical protein